MLLVVGAAGGSSVWERAAVPDLPDDGLLPQVTRHIKTMEMAELRFKWGLDQKKEVTHDIKIKNTATSK